MLDQDAVKPFDGTKHCPMNHYRATLFIIGRNVFQVKSFRHLKIELNSPALPFPADGIGNFEINLGTIKCPTAFMNNVLNLVMVQSLLKRRRRFIPDLIASHRFSRTCRKADIDFLKPESAINAQDQGNAT